MATQNPNEVPQFAHRIDNHDARTKLYEQLTVLTVSGDFELDVEERSGRKYLEVAGCGDAEAVDRLADDPDVPLRYAQSYIDGETGNVVTELEVCA